MASQIATDAQTDAHSSQSVLPPTRIGFLFDPSPFTHLSGYTNRFMSLAEYLLQENVRVVAAHAQHLDLGEASQTQATRFGDIDLVPLKGGQRLWFWFGFKPYDAPTWRLHSMLSWRVGLALHELQPEVLHVCAPGFSVFGGVFWAAIFDVPLVYSYHTHLLKYLDQYMNFLPIARKAAYFVGYVLIHNMMKQPDLVLCPSRELMDHLVRDCGVDPAKVQVWKKGVDAEAFNPRFRDESLRRELLRSRGTKLLVSVGRIAKEKNLEELKPWFAKLPNDCVLAIVGTGPDEAYYKTLFADEINVGSVVFTGVRRGEDLARIFASADVFLMPSRSETLGFVVLEAMASGVPVVATRSGGIPSIIHDGEDSYMYPEGDVEEAVRLTRSLLDDDDLHRRISAVARAEAESMSWAASHSHVHRVQYIEAIRKHAFRKQQTGLFGSLRRVFLRCARRAVVASSSRLCSQEVSRKNQ